MDTVERGEMVEKELDALISRRHDKRVASKGERALEESWAESERYSLFTYHLLYL